jgi:DNA-binding response OmpR family regulator
VGKPYTILVTDSSLAIRTLISEVLIDEGYTVYSYRQHHVTLDAIERLLPDLLILELHRLNSAAIMFLLHQLHRRSTTQTISALALFTDTQLLQTLARPLGQFNCTTLGKPFDLDQLLASIAYALGHRSGLVRNCLEQSISVDDRSTGLSAPHATQSHSVSPAHHSSETAAAPLTQPQPSSPARRRTAE